MFSKKIYTIFWGVPDSWLYAVIALVILDYITGVCAAIHSKELSSEIGAKGIAKKMATFAVISLAHILDEYVLKEGGAIQTMTSIFYIVNESISIFGKCDSNGSARLLQSCKVNLFRFGQVISPYLTLSYNL